MSEKKLYALTDEQVETLIGSADNWSRTLRMNNRESIQEDHAIAALTPVTVDDLGSEAVERMCKAFYEAGADKLDDTIRPQWDNLVRVSTDTARGYRERISAALAVLLDNREVK